MKTLQVQQNQGSSYLSPSHVQRGGDRLAKIHEKRTENSTQVIASQGFKFSPAILGTCQQLSARNVLRPKALNFRQFRRPYIGTADDKSELAGKPGGTAPPLGAGPVTPTGISAPRTTGENSDPEHIGSICQRVLEALECELPDKMHV
jgi:hypothetical protein